MSKIVRLGPIRRRHPEGKLHESRWRLTAVDTKDVHWGCGATRLCIDPSHRGEVLPQPKIPLQATAFDALRAMVPMEGARESRRAAPPYRHVKMRSRIHGEWQARRHGRRTRIVPSRVYAAAQVCGARALPAHAGILD